MPYTYRCETCAVTAPRRTTAPDAKADRREHRAAAHYGLAPDGDAVLETPGWVSTVLRAAAGGIAEYARKTAQKPRPREAPPEHWRQAVLLLAVGAGAILLLGMLVRAVTGT
ncbi:hypothetical protein [Streptomyces niveus]|uniref:hypothetical protein n=1 Tax=Streptomyces niveus TaxID=193462 RepID=UPI00114D2E25|nr:hypothetical protein [Streptomyces niveus]